MNHTPQLSQPELPYPKLCECGCGQQLPKCKPGRPQAKFVRGHRPHKRRPVEERFWSKVDKRGPDDCWLWQASIARSGYGQLSINNVCVNAHRVSYELHFGPIPSTMCVMHTCDVRACVSPHHLRAGTIADNNRDMFSKGRNGRSGKKGESHIRAKITNDQVKEIRELHRQGHGIKPLARQYGISPTQAARIVHHESWTHIP